MKLQVMVALLLLASSARAEVSLAEVLASVELHHPLLLAERRSARAAEDDLQSARGEFDPKVSVDVKSQVRGYYDPTSLNATVEQPTPLLGASVYAGYRLGTGKIPDYYGEMATLDRGEVRAGLVVPLLRDRSTDERRAGVARAGALQDSAEAGVAALILTLQLEAASAYFALRAARVRLSIAQDVLQLAEIRKSQIESKVALGARPPIDRVDNARAIFERTQALISARRDLEKHALYLSLYLRDAQGAPIVLGETDVEKGIEPPRRELPPVSEAGARALRDRPELDAYAGWLEALRVDHALARNQVNPRLDFFGEVSRDLGDEPESLRESRRPAVVEVGAKFSLPIPMRKARGKRDAVEHKLQAMEAKASFARDKITAEVRDAYSALAAAREKVEAAKGAAEAARTLAEGERASFELGATTLLFVNLREQTAAEAEAKYADALAEWNTASVRAHVVLGRPLSTVAR